VVKRKENALKKGKGKGVKQTVLKKGKQVVVSGYAADNNY